MREFKRIKEVKELENGKDISINIYNPNTGITEYRLLEELVMELVALSMPPTFHIEALKCQSIIMRTNLLRQLKVLRGVGVDNISDAEATLEPFEGYKPLIEYKELWGDKFNDTIELLQQAVSETEGVVIYYKNKPIDARYHIVCGGATENSENVHGNIVVYLRRVLCNYCSQSPSYKSYKEMSLEEIEKRLGVMFPKESPEKTLSIEDMFTNIVRDEAGRITKLIVAGKEFKGHQLMELLEINSARFSWYPVTIRFVSKGKGDGIGFCQYGGNQLAREGKTAKEILNYYYTGVELVKISNACIRNPLMGKVIVINPACGGEEAPGHIGSNGLIEKDINLKIAILLEGLLSKQGATIYLTRNNDVFIPLSERSSLANQIKPHFFISIHQNFINQPTISGTEIYYYRGDKEAEKLASSIMEQLVRTTETLNRGVRTADFFLLRDVRVSSLHIEVAYLSNPSEEERLKRIEYLESIAKSIAEGIKNYYSSNIS